MASISRGGCGPFVPTSSAASRASHLLQQIALNCQGQSPFPVVP